MNYLDESSGHDNWLNVTLQGGVRSCVLKDLRKFTRYVIQVQGFTSKGEGKLSKALVLRTDQDGKHSIIHVKHLAYIFKSENRTTTAMTASRM